MDINNRNTDLTVATVALDTYLKIDSDNDITKTSSTLEDIVKSTKEILGDDVSDKQIQNLVRFNDRLVKKVKKDGSLDELSKLRNNTSYKNNLKNTIFNMTNQLANGVDEFSNDGTTPIYHYPLFDNKIFSFDKTPIKNSNLTLSLNVDIDISSLDVTWSVENEPNNSTLTLNVDASKKSISFTPDQVGLYTIKVVAQSADAKAEKTTTFYVKENLALNLSNVTSIDTNESKIIGTVKNQS